MHVLTRTAPAGARALPLDVIAEFLGIPPDTSIDYARAARRN